MEKPDFEEKANQIVFYRWDTENDPDGTKANNFVEDYIEGCEHVWNTHVVPLQEDHDLRGRQLDHYRDQTQKIRTFVFNRNDFGLPNQNIFEAVNDHITQLDSNNKLLREENTKCKDLAWEAANEISRLNKEIERLKAEVLKEKFPPN